jgi:exodeoxyribonuclease-3
VHLVSWNVNGLRAVYKKGFLDWFLNVSPDVLCLQETKLQLDQVPPELLEVPNYRCYFSCAERKGYSGVAVYTRQEPLRVETRLGIERFDNEGRLLALYFPEFVLLNVYFPNGQMSAERLQYKLDFYAAFYDYAVTLNHSGHALVICGDVNTAHTEIDLARPEENAAISGFLPEERAWLDKFLAAGFYDTFRLFNNEPGHYTWWSPFRNERVRNIGWRIDYFFVNRLLLNQVKSASIYPEVMGSDHCPIGLVLQRD